MLCYGPTGTLNYRNRFAFYKYKITLIFSAALKVGVDNPKYMYEVYKSR